MKKKNKKIISVLLAASLLLGVPTQAVLGQEQDTETAVVESIGEETSNTEDIVIENTEVMENITEGIPEEVMLDSTEKVMGVATGDSIEEGLLDTEEAATENIETAEGEAAFEPGKTAPDEVVDSVKYIYHDNSGKVDGFVYYLKTDNTIGIQAYDIAYMGADKKVVIPEKINGYPVTEIDAAAFYGKAVQNVVFPSTLKKIGKQAFDYSALESFSFTGKETVKVGEWAFGNTAMKTIVVPANIKDIPQACFGNNMEATAIIIEEGVETIGEFSFQNNQTATSIKIPSTVTLIGKGAFTANVCVEKLEMGQNVTSIGEQAFCGLMELTSVTLPKSVTNIETDAFKDCYNLIISCYTDTCSHEYAVDNDIDYILLDQPTYTITYVLNGGENSDRNPDTYTSTTRTIEIDQPKERYGYYFMGWYADEAFQNKRDVIEKGSSGNITLYAKWGANQYQINYDGNKGSGVTDSQLTEYDETIALEKNEFVRKGYTFKEWNTKADGSGNSYQEQEKVKNLRSQYNDEITLYAQWTANKYQVTFKGNGATSGSMNTMKKLKYGKTYKLTVNTFKRDGYTFTGWSTEIDGSGKNYNNEDEIKNLSSKSGGKVTLYAQWKKANKTEKKYSITYKLNKGKNNKSNPSSYTKKTATIKLKNATRKGYSFKGWYKDKKYQNKVTQIKKGSTGNVTLYAKWATNQYTIKFNGNGATSGSMKAVKNCKYDKKYTLKKNSFKRKGYTFAGWNTKKDGSGKNYKNKAEVKNLTSKSDGTVTLYAQWKKK